MLGDLDGVALAPLIKVAGISSESVQIQIAETRRALKNLKHSRPFVYGYDFLFLLLIFCD